MMDGLAIFHGPNAGYALDLYDRYLRDPASVDAQTRALFDSVPAPFAADTIDASTRAAVTAPAPDAAPPSGQATATVTAPGGTTTSVDMTVISNVARLARNIRGRGHLAAQLDPLGSERHATPGLTLEAYGLRPEELTALPAEAVGGPPAGGAANAAEALERLRAIYQGTTGYDYSHVHSPHEHTWLRDAVESGRYAFTPTAQDQRALLERLTQIEAFERYLHQAFQRQKRFSIEGNDLLVPILDEAIRDAASAGAREVVIGMAHRGRLNVLAHVLGKPYERLFAEFREAAIGEGPAPTEGINRGWTGDVKYHLGATGKMRQVALTMASNPSHLEFVDPVIEGMARAVQDRRDGPGAPSQDIGAALPILIHGDAAFPGEGVVAETLNLSQLAGYRTGGTLHIIANNGVGFTTMPGDGRSTLYASDLARGFEIPIVHVNADDPIACLSAARLAHAYRETFHKDVLIDLVGYRRWGHNEGDEPAFTQPRLYEGIDTHPTVRALYAQALDRAGVVSIAESDAMLEAATAHLREINRATGGATAVAQTEDRLATATDAAAIVTAVPAETLTALNEALLTWPQGFTPHPRLAQQLERRRAALAPDGAIDFGLAESLAFAAILADGTPIRLTGQDTERGTFSQRHLVLHDVNTDETYTPLVGLPRARASFAVYNSPLSEAGALGFEYGYSVHAPETLVLWEAQFGDFANAGQVIIDQFIAAARAKWRQYPSLVLLLPHGYEGQGPEHSNARLERYLQLSAQDNLRVANPTTAAQYFHLLRRHAALLRSDPHPLIVMTPKSLLRHARAASRPQDLAEGRFEPVLDDPEAAARRDEVTRLALCSGKVYVDLVNGPGRADARAVAIARVEELYPFPEGRLETLIASYPHLRELVWVQEEPRNMGAWQFASPSLHALARRHDVALRYIGRPERASPAVGSARVHAAEQAAIVVDALEGAQSLVVSR